jgi:uridine phosphorylase
MTKKLQKKDASEVYHLDISREDLCGAGYALMPGDPDRVDLVAAMLDNPKAVGEPRAFRSVLGKLEDEYVAVVSHGIGSPSTSIAITELAMLGVGTFIRIGTSGAIAPEIETGDVIISSGAVRLEGASRQIVPIEFPAVPHYEVMAGLLAARERLADIRTHVGISASFDTFYEGQARRNSFTGLCLPEFAGGVEFWRDRGVLNFEMETSLVLAQTAAYKLRGGAVQAVVVNRSRSERVDTRDLARAVNNAIRVAVEGLRQIILNDRSKKLRRNP